MGTPRDCPSRGSLSGAIHQATTCSPRIRQTEGQRYPSADRARRPKDLDSGAVSVRGKQAQTKKYQRLWLVAAWDGDNVGWVKRKADLNSACPRENDERIAILVPTWSIETWLLALLGDDSINESVSRKQEFEHRYPESERRRALRDAAKAWQVRAEHVPSVPSLADGSTEMTRIESP